MDELGAAPIAGVACSERRDSRKTRPDRACCPHRVATRKGRNNHLMTTNANSDTFAKGRTPSPGCYIIDIRKEERSWLLNKRYGVCPDLPKDILEDFNAGLRKIGACVESIADQVSAKCGLSGLVILATFGQYGSKINPTVPPPARVPFEPVELDERNTALLDISSEVLGRSAKSRLLSSKTITALFACVVWAIILFETIRRGFPCGGIVGLVLVPVIGIRMLYPLAPPWWLTPYGLLVEGVLCTPADTIMVIQSGVDWTISLYKGTAHRSRCVSELECMTQLAIWQGAMQAKNEPARPVDDQSTNAG